MDHIRLSQYAWEFLARQLFGSDNAWITPPEKLFLWDSKGIYIDYHYPKPDTRHYVGGEHLLGKRITKVLPQPMAKGVQSSVFQTLDIQEPLLEFYDLTIGQQLYRVAVRFLPFENNVLGLVNDHVHVGEEGVSIVNNVVSNKKNPVR